MRTKKNTLVLSPYAVPRTIWQITQWRACWARVALTPDGRKSWISAAADKILSGSNHPLGFLPIIRPRAKSSPSRSRKSSAGPAQRNSDLRFPLSRRYYFAHLASWTTDCAAHYAAAALLAPASKKLTKAPKKSMCSDNVIRELYFRFVESSRARTRWTRNPGSGWGRGAKIGAPTRISVHTANGWSISGALRSTEHNSTHFGFLLWNFLSHLPAEFPHFYILYGKCHGFQDPPLIVSSSMTLKRSLSSSRTLTPSFSPF